MNSLEVKNFTCVSTATAEFSANNNNKKKNTNKSLLRLGLLN